MKYFAAAILTLVLAGCASTPSTVVLEFFHNPIEGDYDGTVALMSKAAIEKTVERTKSKAIVKGILQITEEDLKKDDQTIVSRIVSQLIIAEKREAEANGREYVPPQIEILEETVDGENAVVKYKATQPGEMHSGEIRLVRENGNWKIDSPLID